jgi:hypothetical protein
MLLPYAEGLSRAGASSPIVNYHFHSVFRRAQHERFRESLALRRVFEGVLELHRCRLGWRRSALSRCEPDQSDVDKKKRMPGDQPIAWPKAEEASRAVRGYLTVLDNARIDEENDCRDGRR